MCERGWWVSEIIECFLECRCQKSCKFPTISLLLKEFSVYLSSPEWANIVTLGLRGSSLASTMSLDTIKNFGLDNILLSFIYELDSKVLLSTLKEHSSS